MHPERLKSIRRILDARPEPHLGAAEADIVALVAFYGSTVLVSWLSYVFLEKPCRRWIRLLEEKLLQGGEPKVNPALA